MEVTAAGLVQALDEAEDIAARAGRSLRASSSSQQQDIGRWTPLDMQPIEPCSELSAIRDCVPDPVRHALFRLCVCLQASASPWTMPVPG